MEVHVKVLGWLHIILNAIYVIIGLGIFLVFFFIGAGTSAATQDSGVSLIAGSGIGLLFGGFFLIFGLPGTLLGYGLLTGKSWSRVLGIIFSFFDLLNFPLGTILGIYGLVVLFNAETEFILSR